MPINNSTLAAASFAALAAAAPALANDSTAELGAEMRKGILAYFEHVNRNGGVNGRKLC